MTTTSAATEVAPSNPKVANDPRLDPRIKAFLAHIPNGQPQPNVASREELLAEEYTPRALATLNAQAAAYEAMDREDIAPSTGLSTTTLSFMSAPDGNTVMIQYIRPDNGQTLPCVYYIHGGRMEMNSCFQGNYKAWGRIIAATGLAVAMVDFRNSVHPDSATDVEPFPAGLNDCLSGLKWVRDNSVSLGIDPARIIIAGESGGGNLGLALGMKLKQDGDLDLIKGIYAMCPYIAGEWPTPEIPSATENDGILISVCDNRATMAYGIDEFTNKNPLAWPSFAQVKDVEGLPPVVIGVNECDPLRDEGINFLRLLFKAGVPARGRENLGACHAVEIFPVLCPDVSRATAADIANFVASV